MHNTHQLSYFEFEFPIWLIRIVTDETEERSSIVGIVDHNHGPCVPIFTDTDLAERFIAKSMGEDHVADYEIVEIGEWESLTHILESVADIKCRYLVVDYFFGPRYASAIIVPIEHLVAKPRPFDIGS